MNVRHVLPLAAITLLLSGCASTMDDDSPPIEYYEDIDPPELDLEPDFREEPMASECDPNYEGACVPIVGYDLDCPDISDPVYVVGTDIHGFDRDRDGVGCELN